MLQNVASAQQQKTLLLSDAIKTGLQNYQSIQAKRNYLKASTASVQNTKNEYLPNVIAAIQQDYGTANGQFGPVSAYGTTGVSSSGPTAASQSWNAAFGGVYVINTNWEAFTFGRLQSKIQFAEKQVRKDSADLLQEQFIQSIKIASAYLNVLIAESLLQNAQANLERTKYVQEVVVARTKSGLNAGVDSSLANADVSKAKLSVIDASTTVLQLQNQLAQLLNVVPSDIAVDTSFLRNIPQIFKTDALIAQNPQVRFYQTRIDQSKSYAAYLNKSIIPSLNLFGVLQTKGSGFDYNYAPTTNGTYSKNYFTGINPTRTNYVAGVSLSWNILSIAKIKQQVISQKYLSEAYQNEYDLISTQLNDQLLLSDQRISNSLQSWKEVPLQLKAASDAYVQKSVLYKNGLTNIIDLQQALYVLNRAETDASVAAINVWQSLLLKVAASGDLELLLKQVK